MNTCPLLELCKCDGNQICLFCTVLTVIFVAFAGGVVGYFIGKRKREKLSPK